MHSPAEYLKAQAKIQLALLRRFNIYTPTHNASETIAPYPADSGAKSEKLFRNGTNRAVRTLKEFELPGTDAVMHREGSRLILELVPDKPKRDTATALVAALISMKDWSVVEEPFPDPDEDLVPLREIDL